MAVTAVAPLFIMMMLGAFARYKKWISPEEVNRFNGMVFKLLFPFMVFANIHNTDLSEAFDLSLLLYTFVAVLITYGISLLIVPRIEKNRPTQGAMLQGIYRSNFVILGIPMAANIYPNSDIGLLVLSIALVVPLYNVMAVLILETHRGGTVKPKRIIRNIFTNPLILGCIFGLLAIPFDFPPMVTDTISQLGAAATPMAVIILGASFHLNHDARLKRNLIICTTAKLLWVPAVFLPLAALLGFRDIAFVTLIAIFTTPCSISSFTMAQQMESDADLAGALVISTSFFSCFTMCLWIFLFKQLGVI